MKKSLIIQTILLLFLSHFVSGQEITIELGPDKIAKNEAWTIAVKIENGRLTDYDGFPDIDGFVKRGTSSEFGTNIINNRMSSYQTARMTYYPNREGIIVVPPFKMRVNNKVLSSPGKKVTVGPPNQVRQRRRDPFQDFFGRDPFRDDEPTEFIDVKEDAFIALTTDKDEVFVGEGINATLSFYVAVDNRAPMNFHNHNEQITEIKKRITPSNTWEEDFRIESIRGEMVEIGKKRYVRYKLHEATFFPLNEDPIVFPSVPWKMIKYKVAKNPSFFGQNSQPEEATFYTKEKRVKVKPLPPHPLKDVVAIGDYRLDEAIATPHLETGRNVTYTFKVFGEGNISSISKPYVNQDGNFDIYEPTVQENINRQNRKVTGSKSFNYYLIPQEPGDYQLADYFQWIFFNPKKEVYDTLRSEIVVDVVGESKKNEVIQSSDKDGFYNEKISVDNSLVSVSNHNWPLIFLNIFIVATASFTIYMVAKK